MNCLMNGLIFQMYLRECLVPELRPGDTVIMDNLGSHKSQAVRDSITEQGAHLLFLPPYSPTSIQSKTSSRNSRPSSKPQKKGPLMICGAVSASSSNKLHRKSAKTSFGMMDMHNSNTNLI